MQQEQPQEINLFEIFDVIAARKFFILIASTVLILSGVAVILTMTPLYKSTATFLVKQAQSSNPLEPWNNLAEQFGYKIRSGSDPLLSNLERVLQSENFYATFLAKSLNPASPDSALPQLLGVKNVAENKKVEAIAGQIRSGLYFKTNDDKTYSIVVTTAIPHLSQFLANGIIDQLNNFFVEREKKEHARKLEFLRSELDLNRGELDSVSNRLAQFLETNKEFSSPALNYRYQKLKREEAIYTEKYMITMKAYQSMNIAASQPDYNFEVVELAKVAETQARPQTVKWILGLLVAAPLFCCVLAVLFSWVISLKAKRATA